MLYLTNLTYIKECEFIKLFDIAMPGDAGNQAQKVESKLRTP